MKLELTLMEATTVARALVLKAESAEESALECKKLGMDDSIVKAWKERAAGYRKVYEKVEAQLQQALRGWKVLKGGEGR